MKTVLTLAAGDTVFGPVVFVGGDLDHDSADRFRAAVEAAALPPGHVLTVDLAGVTFCDSSGITALIAARNHTHALGGDIALAAVPAATARLMRMLGLDQVFRIPPPV